MKININSNVKIYFIVSWIIGVFLLAITAAGWHDDFPYLLVFAAFMNAIFNGLVIFFLMVLLFVFPENRTQFMHSLILLLFNFPFVMFYCLLLTF